MKYNKIEDDYEKIKRVTFEDKENRLFAITKDFCKYAGEIDGAITFDFEPYSEDNFTDDEKEEIKQMLDDGEFDDFLEWD